MIVPCVIVRMFMSCMVVRMIVALVAVIMICVAVTCMVVTCVIVLFLFRLLCHYYTSSPGRIWMIKLPGALRRFCLKIATKTGAGRQRRICVGLLKP
jgi:hypothetical protein